MDLHFDFALLMGAYHDGDLGARYLVCIALGLLGEHIQATTPEAFQKRFGELGTQELSRFTK